MGETWREATHAASGLNLKLIDVRIGSLSDLPQLETICGQGSCNRLLVTSDPLLQNWRAEIVGAAARQKLPTVYSQPEYVRHAPAFDWDVATPWWISSFIPNREAEFGLALMFASIVPIYWRRRQKIA